MSTNHCFKSFYHFNGSFENELKEKLFERYTVVFFPIQSNILSFKNRTQVSLSCDSVNSADQAKDIHAQSYL